MDLFRNNSVKDILLEAWKTALYPCALIRGMEIILVNRAMEVFMGIPREEMIGKKFPEYLAHQDPLERYLEALTEKANVLPMETEIITAEGNKPVTVAGGPCKIQDIYSIFIEFIPIFF